MREARGSAQTFAAGTGPVDIALAALGPGGLIVAFPTECCANKAAAGHFSAPP